MANTNNNDAPLRAALRIIWDDTRKPCKLDKEAVAKICKGALSTPARNCDIGTPDEQAERFETECNRHANCTSCPVHAEWAKFKAGTLTVSTECEFAWAQMPYEEGGNIGNQS